MRRNARGNFRAGGQLTGSRRDTQGRPTTSLEPQKNRTANRLFFERPVRSSRPRPHTQVVILPLDPVWASRALIPITAVIIREMVHIRYWTNGIASMTVLNIG